MQESVFFGDKFDRLTTEKLASERFKKKNTKKTDIKTNEESSFGDVF